MIQAFLKKQENSQINNLIYYLKKLEKNKQTLISRRKEIIKIRKKINKTVFKKTIGKNQELVLWKGKQNWKTSGQTHQEEERGNPNKQNKKGKRRNFNRHCRNKKNKIK